MNDYEKKTLLLNALKIAHADSIMTATEDAYVEALRKSIKATKTLFNQAKADVEDHEIDLQIFSKLSLRIISLEQMIDIALVDGKEDDSELKLIKAAAASASISGDQFERLYNEGLFRAELSTLKCPSCATDVEGEAKFCPNCGSSLETSGSDSGQQVELRIPDKGITIAFAESTAAGFSKALSAAKHCDTYQSAQRGKSRWHAVTINASDSQTLMDIADPIETMRNKELYIRGQTVDWRENLAFTRCANERRNAYSGLKHCFGLDEHGQLNVWGCRKLRMNWAGWSDWFTFGKFIKKDVFQFDLQRIHHELEQQLKAVKLCPHISIPFCSEVLRLIPSQVRVSKKTGWEYRRSYDDADPRGISVTVVTDYGDGYKSKDTFTAIGVQPIDAELPVKIIEKAAKITKRTDVNRKTLGI